MCVVLFDFLYALSCVHIGVCHYVHRECVGAISSVRPGSRTPTSLIFIFFSDEMVMVSLHTLAGTWNLIMSRPKNNARKSIKGPWIWLKYHAQCAPTHTLTPLVRKWFHVKVEGKKLEKCRIEPFAGITMPNVRWINSPPNSQIYGCIIKWGEWNEMTSYAYSASRPNDMEW